MSLCEFVLSKRTENFIIAVIIVNGIVLGLETSHTVVEMAGPLLIWIDRVALGIYTIEIILKLFCLKKSFFKDPWNIFDFLIIAISYLPATDNLAVMRSLRVLRLLLLVSALPRLRIIVRSLLLSLPSIGSIGLLLSLLFYISAIITTRIFGAAFPEWFGSLSASLFTLFQLMTLESWAMGIVRPVCMQFPYAVFMFVPFVLISAFIILNVFIAIIINAMNEANEQLKRNLKPSISEKAHEEGLENIYKKLSEISGELNALSEQVRQIHNSGKINDNKG